MGRGDIILLLTKFHYYISDITESIHIHGYFEAIVGALSAVMLLLITVIVIIILMSHRKKIMQENMVTFSSPYDVRTRFVLYICYFLPEHLMTD